MTYTKIETNWYKREEKIRKQLRQECSLSPYLFNKFIEAIIILKVETKDIKINGKLMDSEENMNKLNKCPSEIQV